jgi:transposase
LVHRAHNAKEVAFSHSVLEPPEARQPGPNAQLSAPFAPRGTAAGEAKRSVKRRKRELNGHLRVYRVRMIPDKDQTRELKRCFSAARLAYNSTVASINGGSAANFYQRRAEYKTVQRPDWAKTVSLRIIDGAVEQAVNAFKTNIAKMAVNPQHTHFHVKFMSHKKNRTEVLRIEGDGDSKKNSPLLSFKPVPYANSANRAECLALFGCNLKSVGGIRLQDKGHVIQRMLDEGRRLKETARVHYDKRTRSFHFLYTYEIPRLEDPDPEFETKRIVATDPGARRFQTFFSPTTGECGVLLLRQLDALERRCVNLDERQSWIAKRGNCYSSAEQQGRRTRRQRHRTMRNKKRKLAKERVRLHDWMTRAHYDSANFLLSRYDVVVAPKLATADMVHRKGRVFGCKVARKMLTWSHYLFTQRLHSAAARYAGRCIITDSGEPGTSKTCTHCGHWDAGLGAKTKYECSRCGICLDRDVNGARNNFLAAYGAAVGIGWDRQNN